MDIFEEPILLKKRTTVSLICTLLMGAAAYGAQAAGFSAQGLLGAAVVQLILTVPVCAVNLPVFRRAAGALRKNRPGTAVQDALFCLSAALCLGYSLFALIQLISCVISGTDTAPAADWYSSLLFFHAGCILCCGSAAQWAAAVLLRRAAAPAEALKARMPASACVLRGRTPTDIPAAEVKAGDIFLLRPGDILPADGVVMEGQSSVEESFLTGSDAPVDKSKGSTVYAGSKNGDNALICRAESTGADTLLSRMAGSARGKGDTLPAAEKAERLCSLSAAILSGAAIVVLIVWLLLERPFAFALTRAAAVLAAGCPLAALLAGPAALLSCRMQGLGDGILFHSGDGVEDTALARSVLLQKDGILTSDRPEVAEIIGTRSVPARFLLGMAAGLESQCDDPAAQAVMRRAQAEKIKLSTVRDISAVPGQGLCGKFAGKSIAGGSREFIAAHCELTPDLEQAGQRLAGDGMTVLYFSLDGHPAGLIAVGETVRDAGCEAAEELRALGLEVVLLTADTPESVRHAANCAHLDENHVVCGLTHETMPEEVRRRQFTGPAALAAGPDLAPALQAAAPGIAFGTAGRGDGIAPVELVRNDPAAIPQAIRLARHATARLERVLAAAAVCQAAVLVLGAVVLSPAICALLSAFVCAVIPAVLLHTESGRKAPVTNSQPADELPDPSAKEADV